MTHREAIDELQKFRGQKHWLDSILDRIDDEPCTWTYRATDRVWLCDCEASIRIRYCFGDHKAWKVCPFCTRRVEVES